MFARPHRRRRFAAVGFALAALGSCSSARNLATARDLTEWVAGAPPTDAGAPRVSVRVRDDGLSLSRRLPSHDLPTAPRVRPGDSTLSGFAARAFDSLLPPLDWPPLAPSQVAVVRRPPDVTREVFLRDGTAVRVDRTYPVPIGNRSLTVARSSGEIIAQSYDIPVDAVPVPVRDAMDRQGLGTIRRATVELEGDRESLRLEVGAGAATRIVRCRVDGSGLTRYRVVPAKIWAPLPRHRK